MTGPRFTLDVRTADGRPHVVRGPCEGRDAYALQALASTIMGAPEALPPDVEVLVEELLEASARHAPSARRAG